jgi:hypothetical protein
MSRYLGRGQVGICQRSGKKVKRKDLVEDGQVKGLLVDKNWWEPYHPQLLPPPMRADGIPHFKPAPDDRLAPPAPVLALGGLSWTQTSNDIAFTDYYVISSYDPVASVYTYVATVYAPDTYSIDAAGSFTLAPFPFPTSLPVPGGTLVAVQAHNQEGGLSAYSNQVTA